MSLSETVAALRTRDETVSVAESCTGGLLAAALTEEPGASKFFIGGVAAYSDNVKRNLLGVPNRLWLDGHGSVSASVAQEMAIGTKRLFDTDYAIAITGIAGPGAGTDDKPIGTVWISIVCDDEEDTKRFNFKGSRSEIRNQAVDAAITMLHGALTN